MNDASKDYIDFIISLFVILIMTRVKVTEILSNLLGRKLVQDNVQSPKKNSYDLRYQGKGFISEGSSDEDIRDKIIKDVKKNPVFKINNPFG